MTMARNALEMTQERLAELAGVTQGAISHWEKGIRVPDGAALERLADALEVLPATLSSTDVSFAKPMYRAAAMKSKKKARKVEGRLELARVAAARILEEVELSPALNWPTDSDPLPPDPVAAAAQLRTVWRIPPGPLLDLAAYVEAAGGVVLRTRFGGDRVDAAFHQPRQDTTRWMLLNTEADDAARVRTTLAHELGHAVLHHYDAFNVPDEDVREKQAYSFALALLLPADEFTRDLHRVGFLWQDFLLLREKWGVSAAAMIRRARDLGLISPHRYTGLNIDRRQAGHWAWEPGEVTPEQPTTFNDVVGLLRENGYADETFAGVAGLPYSRLADLLPEQFERRDKPRVGLRLA